MTIPTGRWPVRSAWTIAALLSVGTGLFSYRYLIGVGPLGPEMLANLFARPWLDLHIAGAATALITGAFQFGPVIRPRRGPTHRRLGRVYVVGCLLGAVAGLVLAFGSIAGPIATAGFGTLSVIWFAVNVLGWQAARQRRFADHRGWMIRSWALTLAAVNLRLYLPLWPLLHVSFVDGYRATSFLAWVPNLLVAEIYLRRTRAQHELHARPSSISAPRQPNRPHSASNTLFTKEIELTTTSLPNRIGRLATVARFWPALFQQALKAFLRP